jgi:hypothetical protein
MQVSGGLDVLETIGKKTYGVLKEHDPGVTRALGGRRGDKPNLSSSLREAKEQAAVAAEKEKESCEARKAHFGFLFDEFQGELPTSGSCLMSSRVSCVVCGSVEI